MLLPYLVKNKYGVKIIYGVFGFNNTKNGFNNTKKLTKVMLTLKNG